MDAGELESLLGSWLIDLKAENKSPQTRKVYRDGVRAFLAWHAINCDPVTINLDRPAVSKFTADLLDRGSASTARSRQLAVRRFSDWLAGEGHIARDELLGVKPPVLGRPVVPKLT